MKTVTQTILYRQALIKYSEKYGVTKAAIRYKTKRLYIYRWKKRYDGTLESLEDRSHRPHHHPNEHTADELKLIADITFSHGLHLLLSVGILPNHIAITIITDC